MGNDTAASVDSTAGVTVNLGSGLAAGGDASDARDRATTVVARLGDRF
jgi:hypothetical protein